MLKALDKAQQVLRGMTYGGLAGGLALLAANTSGLTRVPRPEAPTVPREIEERREVRKQTVMKLVELSAKSPNPDISWDFIKFAQKENAKLAKLDRAIDAFNKPTVAK